MAGLFTTVLVALAPAAYSYGLRRAEDAGKDMSLASWRACYEERGEVPPVSGPRDGVWLCGLPIVADGHTRYRLGPSVGTEFATDGLGLQHVPGPGRRVLVLGASVAGGVYASAASRTWFYQVAKTKGWYLTVCAAPGWRTDQESAGLRLHGAAVRPDLVVTLDGLNDILFTSDDASADTYVRRIAMMDNFCSMLGAEFVAVLQPSLAERDPMSDVERHLLPPASCQAADTLRRYRMIRAGLAASGVRWIDASRALNGPTHTVFTDAWHFADPGHAMLAEFLIGRLP